MDLFDRVHQFGSVFEADLDLDGGAELGCFPERVVEIRIFFEMYRLEIIRPEDQKLFFRLVGLFFFDQDVRVSVFW